MSPKRIYNELLKYCTKIRDNGKHYICFPKNSDKVITVSKTPSMRGAYDAIEKDFKKVGIIVKLK